MNQVWILRGVIFGFCLGSVVTCGTVPPRIEPESMPALSDGQAIQLRHSEETIADGYADWRREVTAMEQARRACRAEANGSLRGEAERRFQESFVRAEKAFANMRIELADLELDRADIAYKSNSPLLRPFQEEQETARRAYARIQTAVNAPACGGSGQ